MIFFFQAEDGIRDLVRSRGLGDVYKRQAMIGTDKNKMADALRTRDAEIAALGGADLILSYLSLIHI